jgi:hypothetical protein
MYKDEEVNNKNDFENQVLFMQTLFGWIFILCVNIWILFLSDWNMK